MGWQGQQVGHWAEANLPRLTAVLFIHTHAHVSLASGLLACSSGGQQQTGGAWPDASLCTLVVTLLICQGSAACWGIAWHPRPAGISAYCPGNCKAVGTLTRVSLPSRPTSLYCPVHLLLLLQVLLA